VKALGLNNGTLVGTWDGGFVSGRIGEGAFSFDGIIRHVEIPASATLEPSHITAMAWVRHLGSPPPGEVRYVLSKGAQNCTAASYAIYSGSGGLFFYFFSDGNAVWLSPEKDASSIWNGDWHLVAGTYDGAMVRLYVDGVEVGTGNPTTLPIKYDLADSQKFLIGAYGHGGASCNIGLTADVDDVRIYNRALTANEIYAIFSPVP
jgi:hypothetical protein